MRKLLFAALALFSYTTAVMAQPTPTKGEVRKVDEPAGKITIRHEPIKNLDMGEMTMVFRVQNSDMLKSVQPGDKVVFEADRVNGVLTVTSIKKDG
jgi:Cu(I)/Ag(I) efflux system periplasmic protein CusF